MIGDLRIYTHITLHVYKIKLITTPFQKNQKKKNNYDSATNF